MEQILKASKALEEINLEDAPSWAKALVVCISNLVEGVKDLNMLGDRCKKLEDISEVRGQIINKLQEDNVNLRNELLSLRQATDDNEQKSRSQCLLFHGIEETTEEDTDQICIDTITDIVGVELFLDDIQRSHRTGPKKFQTTRRTKPRPIILRFSNMRKRMEVFRNKKKLKGMGITITESLTKIRYALLQKAKEKYGNSVWTSEGRIFTKIEDKIVLITSEASLDT